MMNKHNLFLIVFLSVMCWSCDDEQLPEQKPEVLPPTIALTYPEQGISFDLSTTQNISFTWKNDERISDCVLAFSRTNTMSNPQIIAVTGDQYTLTDSALNELLNTLYLSTYAQATLYWSVYPAEEDTTFVKQVSHIQIIPWPIIALTRPESGAGVSLSNDDVAFVWQRLEGITSYTLQISKSADMSSPLNVKTETKLKPIFVTIAEMTARLNELGLTGNPADIYWSIVPTTNTGIKVNTQVNRLRIDKLLRFKRGDWTATSSTINSGFGPLGMFDGAFGTQWCPSGHPAWTIIDMQHEKTVKRIEAHNRMNVKTIECSISVDGQNWTPVGTLNYPTDQNVWKTCTLAQPAAAQYVRLVMEGYSSWAAVSELDVYGFE